MKTLKPIFLVIDIGFILYWAVTLLGVIPEEYLFKDYHNPISIAWNWSFFPLDILISITGLTSIWMYKKKNPAWEKMVLISLTLTFCSGLMAIAFWVFKQEFDIAWWVPNLFIMIYPLFYIKRFLGPNQASL